MLLFPKSHLLAVHLVDGLVVERMPIRALLEDEDHTALVYRRTDDPDAACLGRNSGFKSLEEPIEVAVQRIYRLGILLIFRVVEDNESRALVHVLHPPRLLPRTDGLDERPIGQLYRIGAPVPCRVRPPIAHKTPEAGLASQDVLNGAQKLLGVFLRLRGEGYVLRCTRLPQENVLEDDVVDVSRRPRAAPGRRRRFRGLYGPCSPWPFLHAAPCRRPAKAGLLSLNISGISVRPIAIISRDSLRTKACLSSGFNGFLVLLDELVSRVTPRKTHRAVLVADDLLAVVVFTATQPLKVGRVTQPQQELYAYVPTGVALRHLRQIRTRFARVLRQLQPLRGLGSSFPIASCPRPLGTAPF